MRQALGSRTALLQSWTWQPVAYLSFLPGRSLVRVTGFAVDGSQPPRQWSSVVKIIRGTGSAESGDTGSTASGEIDSGSREALAYRSTWLRDLPGRLRAPRVYAIDDDERGATWLWLEDLHDVFDRHWPLEQFHAAARDLGVFNGAYLVARAMPREPWFKDWLREHVVRLRAQLHRVPSVLADLHELAGSEEVQRRFGSAIASKTTRLFDDQEEFVRALARLPRGLSHHEPSLANLFALHSADGPETVAVDWEEVGPGALGADFATLVFGTLRRCEFDATRAEALEASVFAGYLAGLQEAGWHGPTDQVRLGYAAAIALRCTVLIGTLRLLRDGAESVRTSQGRIVPPEEVIEQRVRLCQLLLDRADEARELMRRA